MKKSAEFTKNAMIQLCHSGLDSQTLRIELLKQLQTVIPFDYVYFSTTDPATQFITNSVLTEQPPAWLMSIFLENEYLQDDFLKFRDMLKRHEPVATLSEATKNELFRSQRYQNMLIPMAMEDELRAIFVSDSACWGTLCLHRESAASRYTATEVAYVEALTPHIADGLRKALLLENAFRGKTPDEPGVLILTDDFDVVAKTPAAEYWLTELAEKNTTDEYGLPLAVRSVVTILKAVESGMVISSPPKVRLQTRSGNWLMLYASRLNGSEAVTQITVIFELAKPAEIAPLIMQAFLLTKRESEITQCVLLGWSTTDISARLHISHNTVQDHLKSIFEKVGVNSRVELIARLFIQHRQM